MHTRKYIKIQSKTITKKHDYIHVGRIIEVRRIYNVRCKGRMCEVKLKGMEYSSAFTLVSFQILKRIKRDNRMNVFPFS